MKVTRTKTLAAAICAAVAILAAPAVAEGPVTYQSGVLLASACAPDCGSAADCGTACGSCVTPCDPCCDHGSGCCCGGGLLGECCGALLDGCGDLICGCGVLLDGCGELACGCGALAGDCASLLGDCAWSCLRCFERCDPYNPCSDGFLLGLFAPSDACFNDFVSPMTNPVFFEDPRTLSELRFIFLQHKVPFAVQGGDVQLMAMQVRAALNDRVSIIVTKDGYITSSNPAIEDGWADANIGLKMNFLADVENQRLLTGGITYELPVGSTRALQGNGDGTINLFATYGEQVGTHGHWLSGMGVILPADGDEESSWWYWSNHLDYHVGSGVYALAEVNWYNWFNSGTGGIPGVEGLDIINLGSTAVVGNDIITGAFGLKYKPYDDMELGIAWENPLTGRRDILENRLTADVILRF